MITDLFAQDVFTLERMQSYLSRHSYRELQTCIEDSKPINANLADEIATAMRTWASQRGATHYTHWFQPLNEGTAEKHDAFISLDPEGRIVEEFSGKLLTQQEPDASSFPNGGLRNTFEARGYSAWDPSSPAFIIDDTLCIPTVFVSYTGEALDFKTPLLKSLDALDRAATRLCRYFYPEVKSCTTFLGWEQEYFLVDKELFYQRPDLVQTGRTLLGHESAKNQQLDDHYFGAIPDRVIAFKKELEESCYRLGIPIKTRHNEVAPCQFEFAPIYESCNLANDHNILLMSLMRRVANRHGLRVLLHEKPYQGLNGSGKHCNWSVSTDTGINLFAPGKTHTDNLRFITFIACTLMAVYRNDALLKASIASAGNMHRLGGQEAPPSIISCFLGTDISNVMDKFLAMGTDDTLSITAKQEFSLAVGQIPELLIDNTDRNRTSPFAFTGNRFEFRALGSSANPASAMISLCTVLAYECRRFTRIVEERQRGMDQKDALYQTLCDYIRESKPIHYAENGYAEEWAREAARRGLNTDHHVPRLYEAYTTPESLRIFSEMGVLTPEELHARNEVKWEIFIKKTQIESRVLGDLCLNHVAPKVIRYQTRLLDNVAKMKEVLTPEEYEHMAEQPLELIRKMSTYLVDLQRLAKEMIRARKQVNTIEELRGRAYAYYEDVCPYMGELRERADKLERIVDHELWPLPKYRELLTL